LARRHVAGLPVPKYPVSGEAAPRNPLRGKRFRELAPNARTSRDFHVRLGFAHCFYRNITPHHSAIAMLVPQHPYSKKTCISQVRHGCSFISANGRGGL